MRRIYPILTLLALVAWLGCSGTNPTKPSGSHQPLAGGGRLETNDPITGNPDSSGPGYPGPDPYPYPYLTPIYSADRDCADNPRHLIISDSASWKIWWDEVAGCQWRGRVDPSTDTTIVDTGCGGRCETNPPFVDFGAGQVVVAISAEYDSGNFCMRAVSISAIDRGDEGTTIRYDVSRLDETCCSMLMRPMVMTGYTPVVAVVTQGPLPGPLDWVRHDTTFACWQPDPNEPVTLHYTSAPCDLGASEQIIRDSTLWEAWYRTARSCDSVGMMTLPLPGGYPNIPIVTLEDSNWVNPGDTTVPGPYPWWGVPYVDFSKFAVLVLRAGEQNRWGGGIWLDKISRDGGTTISYSVMAPENECPQMGMVAVNPTVAVRVPLPLNDPVTWKRSQESIGCGWASDSSWVDTLRAVGP
jgi:hypothetical protein